MKVQWQELEVVYQEDLDKVNAWVQPLDILPGLIRQPLQLFVEGLAEKLVCLRRIISNT